MAMGLQIRGPDGRLQYDSASVTWNQVASFILPGGQGFGKYYPRAFRGRTFLVTQAFIDPPPVDRPYYAREIRIRYRSGYGPHITVKKGDYPVIIGVLMR